MFHLDIMKVLTKLSKLKWFEDIAGWIKACENHLFWSATSTHDGNPLVIWAKFKAFLSHVVNKHTNLDDPIFNACAHGEIGPKKSLTPGNTTIPFAVQATWGKVIQYVSKCCPAFPVKWPL